MQAESVVPNDTAPSIRRRLLVLLLLPALGILAAGTLSDYFISRIPLSEAYDQALLGSALGVADHIESNAQGQLILALPPDAVAILRADAYDTIFFKVTDGNGHFIAGDADLPSLEPAASKPRSGNARYRKELIRMVSYRAGTRYGPIVVTIAETLHKRDRALTAILSTALAVDLGQAGIVLAMILIGVRIALNPLRGVEAQIEQRSAKDLRSLPLESVPIEIRSVVRALNRLFATVSATREAQQRFLHSAAHQLRTPLTGISVQLELMTDEETDPARRERLTAVFQGARRLTHTTQQLLTLARSDEAASLNWEFVPVALDALVETVLTERLANAEAASIDLGGEVEPTSVRGVGWLLTEALSNLVDNAIAYTPAGGSVTISCGSIYGRPFLRVVDTGVGIPVTERERVMERFFRASNTLGAGSGLGLAIVREVAELHEASLSINSGAGGQGTIIEIRFPAGPTAQS